MIRDIAQIDRIYIHCTASAFGNVQIIDEWHRKRGFKADWHDTTYHIGYHFLVLNQFFDGVTDEIASRTDGHVAEGRPIELVGAHVKGDNTNSIGIAYVGFTPTVMQVMAMVRLCHQLKDRYNIPTERIFGHHEFYIRTGQPVKKTCPNFDMGNFRDLLRNNLS